MDKLVDWPEAMGACVRLAMCASAKMKTNVRTCDVA